jgi:hypothetical protein
MLNFLVETKQEYTIQLINVLTPLVYEGLQSIYSEVIKISNSDNVLKNFQTFMQRIPKWNNEIITNETQRIMNNSKSYTWLEDLIKATLKANIIVLTYNPTVTQQIKVDPSLYQNIKINDFIHKIYIECARELWNNPYLFYHQYSPIELKRNQRDSIILIKDCIKEAIRKLLPVKHILQIYLGEELESGLDDYNFEKSISEVAGKNLNKLVQKDLYQNTYTMNGGFNDKLINYKEIDNTNTNTNTNNNNDLVSLNLDNNNHVNNINKDNDDTNTVGSKILDIINNKEINLSDNITSDNILGNTNEKHNLTETSISYNKNEKFQEVFSNNNNLPVLSEKNNIDKKKSKFFANYLNL